jgi:hypothetical protein
VLCQLSEPIAWPLSAFGTDSGAGAVGEAAGTGAGSLAGAMEAGSFFLTGATFFVSGLAFLLPLMLVVPLASDLELDFFAGVAGLAGVGVPTAPGASGAVAEVVAFALTAAFEVF